MTAANVTFETQFRLLPISYSIKLFDESSLFSGKIQAVICRAWKSRIKGRDLYDYIFYLSRKTKINLKYLQEKLIESNYILANDIFTIAQSKNLNF